MKERNPDIPRFESGVSNTPQVIIQPGCIQKKCTLWPSARRLALKNTLSKPCDTYAVVCDSPPSMDVLCSAIGIKTGRMVDAGGSEDRVFEPNKKPIIGEFTAAEFIEHAVGAGGVRLSEHEINELLRNQSSTEAIR